MIRNQMVLIGLSGMRAMQREPRRGEKSTHTDATVD